MNTTQTELAGCQHDYSGFNSGYTVKCVDWAYPTSDNAKQFGHYKDGCWVVTMGDRSKPLKAVASFDSREEAIAHAQRLPFRWSGAFLHCNPEYATQA